MVNPSTTQARVVVDELIRGGVRDVVLCPGSRNAPLAFALHDADRAGRLRLHVRIDERTAGFLAIGLAQGGGANQAPVCVAMTSGTAVANLGPAVVEANYARVPLVVLSANRPYELLGTGANQTFEQLGYFGNQVRANISLGLAEHAEDMGNSTTTHRLCLFYSRYFDENHTFRLEHEQCAELMEWIGALAFLLGSACYFLAPLIDWIELKVHASNHANPPVKLVERVEDLIKQLTEDPYAGQMDSHRKGEVVTCTVTQLTDNGIEVSVGESLTGFIRRADLSRDRAEQRADRFAVGEKVDAVITNVDKKSRKLTLSIKARETAEEKQAVEEYGSSDSGASLGDILGAALAKRESDDDDS